MNNDISKIEHIRIECINNQNQAIKFVSQENYAEAINYFEKSYKNLTDLLQEITKTDGNSDENIKIINSNIANTKKKIIAVLNQLGNNEFKNDNFLKAIEYYKQILNYEPNNWIFYVKIAECLNKEINPELAISFYEEAIKLNPEYHKGFKEIGNIYAKKLNDRISAIKYLKVYLEKNPDNASVCNHIGNLYKEMNKYANKDEQIKYFKKAVELKPDFKGAIRNLAIVYSLHDETTRDAIYCFEKLFKIGAIQDDYFDCACLKIKLGEFKEGWLMYESRFKKFFEPSRYPKISTPRWEGQKLSQNETLLVHYEQGFGDTLCFIRYIEKVKELAPKIILKVQDELLELMKINIPDIKIIGKSTPLEQIKFDYHVPLMSLIHIFKTEIDNVPEQLYLKVDKEKAQRYKKEFFNNNCLKIGISWSGTKGGNAKRDIPLSDFYPLAKLNDVQVYSFQKGYGTEQLMELPNDIKIIDLGKTFNDFSDTAAAMSNIDLFITSDNGVFNLAATMGIKTILILNKPAEWRWLLQEKDKTLWYENVKIFKKETEEENWSSLIQKALNSELRQYL